MSLDFTKFWKSTSIIWHLSEKMTDSWVGHSYARRTNGLDKMSDEIQIGLGRQPFKMGRNRSYPTAIFSPASIHCFGEVFWVIFSIKFDLHTFYPVVVISILQKPLHILRIACHICDFNWVQLKSLVVVCLLFTSIHLLFSLFVGSDKWQYSPIWNWVC